MSLKDKIASASLGHRDVEICLNGQLVMQRETALAALLEASRAHRQASLELAKMQQDGHPDDRLGKPVSHPILESAKATTAEKLEEAQQAVQAIEDEIRGDVSTFRVHAIPKQRFEEIKLQGDGEATATYSLLARESVRYVNEAGEEEEIPSELWDQLEPNMTAGQWQEFVDAIDEMNLTLVAKQRAFLARGSQTTQP